MLISLRQGNLLALIQAFFAPWTRAQITLACLCLTLIIVMIDPLGSWKLPTTMFYVTPVMIVAWNVSGARGVWLAILTVILWMSARVAYGVPFDWLLLLNASLRVIMYIFFAIIMARVKHLQDNLRALAEERAHALAQEAARSLHLEREIMETEGREKRRIGQDLHDGLCQHLAATALAARIVTDDLKEGRARACDAQRVLELVEEGISLTREIAKGLYPIEARNDGLMLALEELAAKSGQTLGLDCCFVCDLPVLVENAGTAANLYRIAQESIANAQRHGQATRIEIRLEEADSDIKLCVHDNGCGLSAARPEHSGMGLHSMADRASAIGGQFFLRSSPRGGTEAICIAPIR